MGEKKGRCAEMKKKLTARQWVGLTVLLVTAVLATVSFFLLPNPVQNGAREIRKGVACLFPVGMSIVCFILWDGLMDKHKAAFEKYKLLNGLAFLAGTAFSCLGILMSVLFLMRNL